MANIKRNLHVELPEIVREIMKILTIDDQQLLQCFESVPKKI